MGFFGGMASKAWLMFLRMSKCMVYFYQMLNSIIYAEIDGASMRDIYNLSPIKTIYFVLLTLKSRRTSRKPIALKVIHMMKRIRTNGEPAEFVSSVRMQQTSVIRQAYKNMLGLRMYVLQFVLKGMSILKTIRTGYEEKSPAVLAIVRRQHVFVAG